MNPALTRNRSLVLALLALALAVRLVGLNFDQSHFYHPDERRIAEAVTQLSLRPLQPNPHFFAYGSFPFYVTKLATATLANFSAWFATYDGAVLTGRALSALWGTGTVLLLVVLGRRLYGARTGLLAGALLATTVLHVQNSHFATNDVPLTFLVLLALMLMVEVVERGRPAAYAAAGAAIGLAVATKFSALPLLLPLAVAAAMRARTERTVRRAIGGMALGCACAAAAFAVGEPYALLDARGWLHDILEQSRMVRHAGLMPYTTQYVGVPKVFYDLREMVVWGMGPLLGLTALAGTFWRIRRGRAIPRVEWVLLAWVVPFFAVTCSFDVKFVRYLLPIYPLVVLWGAAWLQEWAGRGVAGRWARGAVVGGTAVYLLAFLAIYTRPHAAVTASKWFYAHAAPGSRVLIQDWDEGFPFSLPGLPADRYKVTSFGFYDADTPAKITRLAGDLASSDWLVLQTKRLYGAVTRAPARYPLTNNFFRELFAGDLGYTLVKDVASRPSLFGVELPDELADESFSVYDHPKALIFRNTGRLAAAALAGKVLNSLPSRPVSRSDMLLARAGGSPPGGRRVIRSSAGGDVVVRAPPRGPRPGGVRAWPAGRSPRGPASTLSPRWSACSCSRTSPGSRPASGWPPSRPRCCGPRCSASRPPAGSPTGGGGRPALGGPRWSRARRRSGGRSRSSSSCARRTPRSSGARSRWTSRSSTRSTGRTPCPRRSHGSPARRSCTPTSDSTRSPRSARRSRSSRR